LVSTVLLTGRRLALICLVSAGWAFSFGLGAPLASLWLSGLGCSQGLVGLGTSIYYLGIALAATAVPWLLRRGGGRCPVAGILVSGLTVAAFPWGGSLAGLFALRFATGVAAALSLIPLETLVNRHSPAEHRSRNFGLYAFAIALGWALGNVVGLQMYEGAPQAAFVLGGFVTIAAGLLLWAGFDWPAEPVEETTGRGHLPWRQGLLGFGSAWGQGFLEGAMVALLPLYLLALGMSNDGVSWLTGGIMIGVILFQVPVAWLADRLGRAAVLLACYAVVIGGLLYLPFCTPGVGLVVCLFLTGACSGAFYPLGLALLGEQVHGAALSRASACYLALNCLGSLIGPALTGVGMDWLGRPAMGPIGAVSTLLVLLVWAVFRSRPVPVAADHARTERRAA
jgi:MFS family permease